MSPSNHRNLAYGRLKAPRKRLNKKKFPKLRKNEVRPLEFTEEDHDNDDKIDQDLLSFEEEEEDYSLNDNDENMEQNDCLLGNENVDLEKDLTYSETSIELISSKIEVVLLESGASNFFTVIKGIKYDHFKSILRRAAKFYAYSLLKRNWFDSGENITSDVILSVIYDENNLILEYCSEILSPRLKSSTVKNTICHILAVSKWLHLFGKMSIGMKKDRGLWNMFYDVISAARSIYATKESRGKFENIVSIEDKIQTGEYPANGLQGLQDLAIKYIAIALSIIESSIRLKTDLNRKTYKKLMSYIMFGLYALGPQGRACGIESLKEAQIPDIFKKGLALSTDFKTAEHYHYQPIPFAQKIKELVERYISYIRPQPLKRAALNTESNDRSSNKYVFLNYDGERYKNIGRLIADLTRDVSYYSCKLVIVI